jgi:dTDP-4-amino-4,6-dideoxygalactose transaminase
MQPFKQPIYVTRPFLPPLADYTEGLQEIWHNHWLSNSGPILKRFEKQLSQVLQTENICLFNNGSLALQVGLNALELSGEVITTPFTFVATTNALVWNQLTPVFADIEPDYFTLDPNKVEALITPKTSAIVAVHVFGFPCQLQKLAAIADKYHLKLIYDAAHAFNVEVDGKPIASFGDLSMFSFHATKHFHTIEGGCLVFKQPKLKHIAERMAYNGLEKDNEEVNVLGTNAKMTEFQALMGEKMLPFVGQLVLKKKRIAMLYRERLADVPGIRFCPMLPTNIAYNYSFMPIQVVKEEFGADRDYLFAALKQYNVFARKYFYPLIPHYQYYRNLPLLDNLHNAKQVEHKILTLPIYGDLALDDVHKICDIILAIQRQLL